MTEFSEVCQQAARIGAAELLRFQDQISAWEKGPDDWVTDADLASQTAIHDYVLAKFPEHRFVGEETIDGIADQKSKSPFCWVVDPLDGTLNYIHQLPSYGVSVALKRGNQVIAGAVFDPVLDEMFAADDDGPATLNGEPIRVSRCQRLENALVVVSLPTQISAQSPEVSQVLQILFAARSVRRLGSAALNLCYVAMGRLDAYWATSVREWDVASGFLILERAGGTIEDLQGGRVNLTQPRFVAAASKDLCSELRSIL